ncbi:heterokaryon incompatibility, partial [Lineolata rhizophorae]
LRNCPKYQAVSYTWDRYDGDFGRVEKVFCGPDRDVVPVTRNCLAALQYLRRQYETRTLWLDMLCIDQSNADERNHQVSLMKEIYFNASEVLIYMGESVENFELISRLSWPGSNQKACLRDGADERRASLKAVKEFLSRRWFTRVWVLQEVAVARR